MTIVTSLREGNGAASLVVEQERDLGRVGVK
jgi:hypothetical protein